MLKKVDNFEDLKFKDNNLDFDMRNIDLDKISEVKE